MPGAYKLKRGTPLSERYKIDENGCWIWLGGTDSKGYPHMRWNGKVVRVTRLMKAMSEPDVWGDSLGPPDKDAHHACSVYNRLCINPEHIEWLPRDENRNRRTRRNKRYGY